MGRLLLDIVKACIHLFDALLGLAYLLIKSIQEIVLSSTILLRHLVCCSGVYRFCPNDCARSHARRAMSLLAIQSGARKLMMLYLALACQKILVQYLIGVLVNLGQLLHWLEVRLACQCSCCLVALHRLIDGCSALTSIYNTHSCGWWLWCELFFSFFFFNCLIELFLVAFHGAFELIEHISSLLIGVNHTGIISTSQLKLRSLAFTISVHLWGLQIRSRRLALLKLRCLALSILDELFLLTSWWTQSLL